MNEINYRMSHEDYLAMPGVSASTLVKYKRSAYHGHYFETHPEELTDSKEFGELVHTMLLEPKRFAEDYVIIDTSPRRGTKSWQELEEMYFGKHIIKADEAIELRVIQENWDKNKDVQGLLKGADREVSCFWVDHEYREQCKCRPDIWKRDVKILADVKTTTNAAPGAFRRQIEDLGYYMKAGWYMDGVSALGERAEEFAFIAIETKLPCCIAVYCLDPSSIELGRREMRDLLKLYRTCKSLGEWPSYPSLTDIGLAPWAKKELEERYGSTTTGAENK